MEERGKIWGREQDIQRSLTVLLADRFNDDVLWCDFNLGDYPQLRKFQGIITKNQDQNIASSLSLSISETQTTK